MTRRAPEPVNGHRPGLLRRLRGRLSLAPLYDYLEGQARLNRESVYWLGVRLRDIQQALGRIEARQTAALEPAALRDCEFQVFSQWGEDGIIQHLLRHVPVTRKLFVEFGVESYEQANTRFLLVNDNWSGLVIDGDPAHVEHIRQDRIYWLYNLKAAAAFITAENINALLAEHGATGDIGLLSIDIDGMDYWVWKAIDVVTPAIVVIEFNALFGPDRSVTVPYRPDFDRRKAHHSTIYYGASLRALCKLGKSKGYDLVGVGSAGLNAFFVRKDLRPESLPAMSCADAFVPGQFCEYHDAAGERRRLSIEQQQQVLRSLPLVEV